MPVLLRTLLALMVLAVATAWTARAEAGHKLRIATLAPKNSSWGKTFVKWQKKVKKKTDGALELEVYFNAVQGNEDSMVSKMKTGQLDGAALTSVGLSSIYKNVLVLQLPGVVDSWENLDKVRASLQSEIEEGFEKKGFRILGWGDVGLSRQFSKGFPVRRPDDVKGKRPLVWRNEPMGPAVYSIIGGVVPVPLGVPEVLPALRAGNINILNAPALAAEQLQWTPNLDHVAANVTVCAIGGTIFRKKALDDLPADVRDKFDAMQKKAAKKSSKKIRRLDADAYDRITKKMTVVDLSDSDRKEWEKVLRKAVQRMAQGTYPKDLVDRVVKLSGKS
jgi:TRAP-type C4-dicarboxylate transport system substrate-binding protein